MPEPQIFLGPFNNPIDSNIALEVLEQWKGRSFANNEELNAAILSEVELRIERGEVNVPLKFNSQIYGNHEYWLSYYDFFWRECDIKDCSRLEGLFKLSEVCGWWTPLANVCLFQHPPEEIHLINRDNAVTCRLHNETGAAIKYRGKYDHADVYAVMGVRVKKSVIERNYTVKDIDEEKNAEVRRVMITLYGQAKYILDSNAKIVHTDDFGTLYAKEQDGDEILMMVKVVNSTPEPDGSFKDYFLRVDPNAYGGLKTAHAAVASTWRNSDGSMVFSTPEEYDPDIQT